MTYKRSTLYLVLTLCCVSAVITGIIIGCDEKTIEAPVVGSSAGSGSIGGGDTQAISLTASPSSTITAIGEEQVSAVITALVKNSTGGAMADGTAVYWTCTVGTLDSTTTTTSNGSSSVTLTFPKNYTGNSVVKVESGDASESITISVVNVTPTPTETPTPTPAEVFIVSAGQPVIPWNGSTTITALVLTDGLPEVNMQVTFTLSGTGASLDASAAVTDSSGEATVTLTGNNTSTSSEKTITITATTSDGRSGSVKVTVEEHP